MIPRLAFILSIVLIRKPVPTFRDDALSARALAAGAARLPHLFEVVEVAHLGAEDVDEHVTGVDQHPVAVRHALHPQVPYAGLAQIFEHAIGDRADMTVRPSG